MGYKVLHGAIELGDRVRDRITGYEGIVIAETNWLNMCTRYTVQGESLKDSGKPVESMSFDDRDLELLAKDPKGYFAKGKPVKATGGPRPEPERTR